MASLTVAVVLVLAVGTHAQQPGKQKNDQHPPLMVSDCTAAGCTSKEHKVVIDANWMWEHKVGTYTNCYEGDEWDKSLCPDPVTCAQNCALDAGTIDDYKNTYGVSSQGDALSLKFVTKTQYGTNVGSRNYLMQDDSNYRMFMLKNKEFSFDVDVSTLPCGLNGALYFVQMDQDGGLSKYPNNKAGAAYGTGYCDAQCPHDLKFINGEANILDWTPSPTDPSSGTGKYGTCCTEMDVWEANSMAWAVTPHPCNVTGQTRCQGVACGDGAQRNDGVCDKSGGDLNPYRLGVKNFYGKGQTVDTSTKFTVVTQWITHDNTTSGNLVEIRRKFVQNGKVFETPSFQLAGATYNSVTDAMVTAQKKVFNGSNTFGARGGLKTVGDHMDSGMVLVLSLWDDYEAHMLWLDSDFPPNRPVSQPGVSRGPCANTSGNPKDVESQSPDATVIFSNIRFGDIGTTGGGPSPPPPGPPSPSPPPPPPPSPPSPGVCTGCGYSCDDSCHCGSCTMQGFCDQSEQNCLGPCNGGNAKWCGPNATVTN